MRTDIEVRIQGRWMFLWAMRLHQVRLAVWLAAHAIHVEVRSPGGRWRDIGPLTTADLVGEVA